MARREKVEVVVVGSGAGGSPVAAVLAEAGARVLVLDKGPRYGLEDYVHDEVGIVRRDFWVPWPEQDPHTIRPAKGKRAQPTREGWISQNVGGGTVHMTGFFYRLKPSDLMLATRTGGVAGANLADWPITLAELLPYYDEMEARIGVSGLAGVNPFEHRTRPFPLPPLRAHPAAALLDEAANSLGWHAYPTPRAVLSQAYGNRPPCNQCGYCGDYGCENNAKSSTQATLLADAEATGRCELRPDSMVYRVVIDPQGRARGVEYLDRAGAAHRVEAQIVVLAASPIESARLLLMSTSPAFPNGLANSSGLVGRNLTFSTFGKGTAIFSRRELAEALGEDGMDLPFLQRSIQDDYWNPELSFAKGGTYNFIMHHPNPINAALRLATLSDFALWGHALKDRIHRYFHEEKWLEFEVFGEFLPHDGCFMDLDPVVVDHFGLPAARITLAHHPVSRAVSSEMVARGMRVFEAMKPAPLETIAATRGGTTYHLQHGVCRFGDNPRLSVLDRNCQAHDVPNLYVTDASFMPTSGAVPATATVLANALRVAHHLVSQM